MCVLKMKLLPLTVQKLYSLNRYTDRQMDRQTDRWTDRQTDGQTDTHTHTQTQTDFTEIITYAQRVYTLKSL